MRQAPLAAAGQNSWEEQLRRIDDYILGNEMLHHRFNMATQIVGKAVCSVPDSVTLPQLKQLTGRPAKELACLCARLSLAGVLEPAIQNQNAWRLACDPAKTTLEDVFRCVLTEQLEHSSRSASNGYKSERSYRDVDLLLMQLSIAINQSIFKHLRQFTLERLKLSVSTLFPFTEQPVRTSPSRRIEQLQNAGTS